MLSKSISVSEKVNELADIFHMLLYTWMISHTDDYGRMTGSPSKVRALVVPMLNKSASDVETALHALNKAGLVVWYEIDNAKYVQINNFEEHQKGLHKRTNPKIPAPPEDSCSMTEIALDSEKFPEVPESSPRTELKGTEQKGKEKKKPLSSSDDVLDVISYLNKQANRMFGDGAANRKEIKARMNKKAMVEQCKLVIDWKVSQWIDNPEMAKNLNPTTLFRASHFDRYLDEAKEGLVKRGKNVDDVITAYAEDGGASPFAEAEWDASKGYFTGRVK